jgi:hypothetical protein
MPRAVAAAAAHVIKKLGPNQHGALRWAAKFGASLLCVRYRVDAEGGRQYTTVELLVDVGPTPASREEATPVALRIGYAELDLRQRVKAAGAQWDKQERVWRLSRRQAKALGLLERLVQE